MTNGDFSTPSLSTLTNQNFISYTSEYIDYEPWRLQLSGNGIFYVIYNNDNLINSQFAVNKLSISGLIPNQVVFFKNDVNTIYMNDITLPTGSYVLSFWYIGSGIRDNTQIYVYLDYQRTVVFTYTIFGQRITQTSTVYTPVINDTIIPTIPAVTTWTKYSMTFTIPVNNTNLIDLKITTDLFNGYIGIGYVQIN